MAESHKIDETGVNGLKSALPGVRAARRTGGGVWLKDKDGNWQAVEEGQTVTETDGGYEVKSSSKKSTKRSQKAEKASEAQQDEDAAKKVAEKATESDDEEPKEEK